MYLNSSLFFRKMPPPNFRDEQCWIELRKRTFLDDRLGVEECYYWCQETHKILLEYSRNHHFRMIEGAVSSKVQEKYDLFVNSHRVLAKRYKEGIFIADGTAGQILEQYALGYYGYAHAAPKPLGLFYECAIKWAGIR